MIPLIVAAAGMAIQAGGAIAKSINGAKRSKEAREALENYQRQTLENAVRGKVGVSRLSADLQAEEMARSTATSIDALRSGGVRAMAGGMGRIQANNNVSMRQIGSDLDKQKQHIDKLAIQDDQRIRQMQERREEADLAGLGREIESGRQDAYAGIGEFGQIATSAGMMAMQGGMGQQQGPRGVATPVASGSVASTATPQFQNPMAGQGMGVPSTTTAYNPYAPTFQNPMLNQGRNIMPG